MNFTDVQEIKHMPLTQALLCLDCDTVYDMTVHQECPCCTGKHYIKLDKMLGLMGIYSDTPVTVEEPERTLERRSQTQQKL